MNERIDSTQLKNVSGGQYDKDAEYVSKYAFSLIVCLILLCSQIVALTCLEWVSQLIICVSNSLNESLFSDWACVRWTVFGWMRFRNRVLFCDCTIDYQVYYLTFPGFNHNSIKEICFLIDGMWFSVGRFPPPGSGPLILSGLFSKYIG